MTEVKICGIGDTETLLAILDLPADYVGFVFAKSRRQVAPEAVRGMIAAAKGKKAPLPKFVGVFVNPSLEEVLAVLESAPLDCIQLHGQESPEFCREVKKRTQKEVFKAISIPATEPLRAYEQAGLDVLMLDTAGGGTGTVFPWDVIPEYRNWARAAGVRLFVAGGLNPDNVGGLIAQYRPDGVDVSSGVETDGVKDIGKIASFIERVKWHDELAGR